ncbi:MAG: hypothetical protein MJ128_05305 [Mogibacterium sp.]|nr:hypothetical protein [Mogibacterium sp.]
MNEADFDKAVRSERNKLRKLFRDSKIPAHKMKVFEPIIENVALMKVKLDELRDEIAHEDFMVEYDNGGGQKGIRENPKFKRYESFFKTFMIGMSRIIDELPDEISGSEAVKIEGLIPKTVLDQVREKSRGTA